jgi:type I restriction enzyme M protein
MIKPPTDLIQQNRINAAIWSACDTFRGTIDPSVYKDYVLTMLFLKYISDVWQEHYEKLAAQHGDQPKLIEALLQTERFVLPRPANFYTLHQQRNQPGNSVRIDQALTLLEQSNPDKLAGVFQDIQFHANKLGEESGRNASLCELLNLFANHELNLSPSRVGNLDIIGNAYEFLIRNFASSSGKKAGEFYTPPEISELMALLVEPVPGDHICDPTCGSGSLLMKCGKLIQMKYHTDNYHLYGQEAIGSTWALAKMNMFLHNEDRHQIIWGDTLRAPSFVSDNKLQQFDVVVANPPFSLEKWGHDLAANDVFQRFSRGIPPKSMADYAFILHMLATMKPKTGRMTVVVPAGVLFRGGSEMLIRQQLVDENLLDTVIGLPKKLFYGSGIAAVILIFRSKKTDKNILFIDASKGFRKEQKNQNTLREEDIELILNTCHARSNRTDYAHLATMDDIKRNRYDLSIARYINAFDDEPKIDLDNLRQEREYLRQELLDLDNMISANLKLLVQETEFQTIDHNIESAH